jgi:Spy/CpxP family protein refolding chaperone
MVRLRHALFLATALLALPSLAQPPAAPPDTMQMLRTKLMADKKQLVSANMDLTQAEAAAFWPIYDEYQRELHKLNDRLATIITAYARAHNANSLTDAQATAMMKEAMAVEDDESLLRQALALKLNGVLPGRKAVRYLQLENKVRALIKYEIAAEVPLVP